MIKKFNEDFESPSNTKEGVYVYLVSDDHLGLITKLNEEPLFNWGDSYKFIDEFLKGQELKNRRHKGLTFLIQYYGISGVEKMKLYEK